MSEETKSVEEKKEEASVAEEKKPDVTPAKADKEDKKDVEVPKKFKSLVEEIEKMSVLDLAELVSILEDKFGVSAAAPAMMMAPGVAGGGDAPVEEEKTAFNVELTEIGESKIGVIKAVKAATGLGLADAKGLVDGAPTVIKENVPKAEAEELKKTLEEVGAKVTLK